MWIGVFSVYNEPEKGQTVTGKHIIHLLIVPQWWSGDEEYCHTLSSELHLSPLPGLEEYGLATDTIKERKNLIVFSQMPSTIKWETTITVENASPDMCLEGRSVEQ